MFDRVQDTLGNLERRLDRRLDAIDRKLDERTQALDTKMSRQFLWLVGVQITTSIAVLSAMAAMIRR